MSFPSPADDYREPPLNLNDLIVHPAATFFLRMKGLAMEPTLHSGDVLIVDRVLLPLDGRAVIVIFQGKFRVRRIESYDDKVILKADYPAFMDIVADPGEVQVWGVVTYALHRMK